MDELALNILDIACNSVKAGAGTVTIDVAADTAADRLTIRIADDGKGMDPAFAATVTDPFTTTRTTRKVGMGIPLFKMAAEMSGGTFSLGSAPGKGTTVTATFTLSHVDRMPLGDLASTVTTLIGGAPGVQFVLNFSLDGAAYRFDTREVRAAVGDDLSDAETLGYIGDMIAENIDNIKKGVYI